MKLILLLSLSLLTAGCAGLGAQGMTAAQIKELAKDDAATGFCNRTVVTTVETTTTYGRIDKGTRQNMSVSEKCALTFTDTTSAAP